MALVLNQYISDKWYEIYRKNIDKYIDHFGQEVRLLKRTEVTYNLYADIVKDISTATTEKAVISRNPIEFYFTGSPLGFAEDSISSGYFAYFKRSSLVRVDDIIVIESKSVEGDIVLDAFEVSAIKGKRLEQEIIRKFILSPFRDSVSSLYESDSVLIEDEISEINLDHDVASDPGGFSEKYYETTKIIPSPGTENIPTPAFAPGHSEEYFEIYKTSIPDKWKEAFPYDVGKPIDRNSDS